MFDHRTIYSITDWICVWSRFFSYSKKQSWNAPVIYPQYLPLTINIYICMCVVWCIAFAHCNDTLILLHFLRFRAQLFFSRSMIQWLIYSIIDVITVAKIVDCYIVHMPRCHIRFGYNWNFQLIFENEFIWLAKWLILWNSVTFAFSLKNFNSVQLTTYAHFHIARVLSFLLFVSLCSVFSLCLGSRFIFFRLIYLEFKIPHQFAWSIFHHYWIV